jgi:hypothetical protein
MNLNKKKKVMLACKEGCRQLMVYGFILALIIVLLDIVEIISENSFQWYGEYT